jgi:cytochrome c
MNTFELNKFAGAALFAGLIAMAAWLISAGVYNTEPPHGERAKLHYAVPGADEADGHGDDGMMAEVEVLSIGALLASGDAAKGAKVFKKCAACHTPEVGGKNKVGPNLWNIVNRPVASVGDFAYSDAMAGMGGNWDIELLSAFLADPKATVPGTKMAFKGLSKDGDRANLLLYLNGLSDAPAALPTE